SAATACSGARPATTRRWRGTRWIYVASAECIRPALQQLVQRLLDGLADLVAQVEHDHRVDGGVDQIGGRDRLAELDEPLARQRDQPERSEPREGRRHRE